MKGARLSIESKAKLSAGRSRCNKCQFWKDGTCADLIVAKVCFENYVRGYIKGYNQRKKKEQQ